MLKYLKKLWRETGERRDGRQKKKRREESHAVNRRWREEMQGRNCPRLMNSKLQAFVTHKS